MNKPLLPCPMCGGKAWMIRKPRHDDRAQHTGSCTLCDQRTEVDEDHRRLVRELDVLLNGDGAAQQASLCDIVGQVAREGIRSTKFMPPKCMNPCPVCNDVGVVEVKQQVPDGWQLVPVEPTEGMYTATLAACEAESDDETSDGKEWTPQQAFRIIYRAMIAAAQEGQP